MQTNWSYYSPVKVFFGLGSRAKLIEFSSNKKCLIVTTKRGQRQFLSDPLLSQLIQKSEVVWLNTVKQNPSLTDIEQAVDELAGQAFGCIIGFGGGSAIDASKALSVMLAAPSRKASLSQLITAPSELELIYPLPLYTIPTTSGTGSEVTPFATIWDTKAQKKLSLNTKNLYPKAAFIDPELSLGLPEEPTINTGLDAINQAAESIWNKNANPLTLGVAYRSLQLGLDALPKLAAGNNEIDSRINMAECSLLAGLAISQTRTAICHSISYPLTANFGVPHGLACAFTMAAVAKFNTLTNDARFTEVQAYTSGKPLENALTELCLNLRTQEKTRKYIPSLNNLLHLIPQMHTPERAGNNIRDLTNSELKKILIESWGEL